MVTCNEINDISQEKSSKISMVLSQTKFLTTMHQSTLKDNIIEIVNENEQFETLNKEVFIDLPQESS